MKEYKSNAKRREDLTGMVFGRLTAIAPAEDHIAKNGYHRTQWLCQCECGNQIVALSANLKRGNTNSCGCYKHDVALTACVTHGDRHSRLYRIWTGIKTRCFDAATPTYRRYGARGISMCDEWVSQYQAFKDWSMSHGYNDSLTIDRIDNNGNYCPENCRWVTAKVQANNRSSTKRYDYNGSQYTISELSDMTGVKYHTLLARIERLNWSIEQAVNTPTRT